MSVRLGGEGIPERPAEIIHDNLFSSALVMESGPIDGRRKISDHDVLLVQFALDGPPFVPDFRCSTLSLAAGKFPIATAEYFAWDLSYRFEYYCTKLHDQQSIL